MGIHTSEVTTLNDGDLSINPNGTGKVVLPALSGSGEVPVSVDASGNVKPLDERQLTELSAIDPSDLMMVQRGADYYSFDVNQLSSGGSFANPAPGDISWSPSTPPGSGTQADPYILTAATCFAVGGDVSSVETATVINQKPDSVLLFTEIGGTSGFRFDQPSQTMDNTGRSNPFKFVYNDTPNTSLGQTYDGVIRMGPSGTYVKWAVTQIANLTRFSPAGIPNASPGSVDYAFDNKYGKVSGTYADGPGALTATNAVRFTIGSSSPLTVAPVATGDVLGILFDAATVDAAAQGDEISGTVSTSTGFFLAPSFTVNRNADPFTPLPSTNAGTSSVVSSSNISITGINCKSYVTLGTATLTSVEASVNGATFAAIPASGTTMPINPGDTLIVRGTTGSGVSTAYSAQIKIGTTAATWSVTTSSASPSISQPNIISPVNGAANIVPDIEVIGSAYGAVNGAGTHASSDWEVYQADVSAQSTSVITAVSEADGTWSLGSTPGTYSANWTHVAYGASNFVATAMTGQEPIMYSTDGVSWTNPSNNTGTLIGSPTALAYGNGKFVALKGGTGATDALMVSYSTDDGVLWNVGTATGITAFSPIAAAYGGGKFVCVGGSSVVTSTDGINWTETTGTPTGGWQSIVYGGNMWVCVARPQGGAFEVMYSTNGTSWNPVAVSGQSTSNVAWMDVTYGNGKFVAVSERVVANVPQVMYSTDGINWTTTNAAAELAWQAVAYGNGTFIAAGEPGAGGVDQVMYSYDGINWTSAFSPTGYWYSIAYGDNKFVAVEYGLSQPANTRSMYSISGTGGLQTQLTFADSSNLGLFSAGFPVNETSGGAPETAAISNVSTSADGAWFGNAMPTGPYWKYAATDGSSIVALSGTKNSSSTNVAAQSFNGVTFTGLGIVDPSSTGTSYTTHGFVYGNGKWVALITNPIASLMHTTDLSSWIQGNTGVSGVSTGWDIKFGGGNFLFIASDFASTGTYFFRTSDASSITQAAYDSTIQLTALAYGNGRWFAYDNRYATGPRWRTSTDTTNWTTPSAPAGRTGLRFSSIAYGGGKWVMTGVDTNSVNSTYGVAFYSLDGISWTEGNVPTSLAASGQGLSLVYANGYWLALSGNAAVNAIWYSVDGINWAAVGTIPGITASADQGFMYSTVGNKYIVFDSVVTGGPNNLYYSETGTGQVLTTLTLTDNTNLANLQVGDAVTETGGDGTGTVLSIGATSLGLSSSTGTWSNADTVTGPTFTAATGTVGSVDAGTNKITLSSSDQSGTKRWLVTEAGYETAKKINAGITSPSLPQNVTPGAPTTDPPSASIYTQVVDSAADTTNLVEYPLTNSELTENKAYYSRVRYNDNGAVVSPFSEYGVFLTKETFAPTGWISAQGPTNVAQQPWNGVTYGNGKWVAVANTYSTGTNGVMYSTDAANWTIATTPSGNWTAVAYGGGTFVAAGIDASSSSFLYNTMYSQNGINWTSVSTGQQVTYSAAAYGGGRFVVCGGTGTSRFASSTDGTSWTANAIGATSNWQGITYGNGYFIAVASTGPSVAKSSDGISWTMVSGAPSGSYYWNSIAYGNGRFVATGSVGAIMYSTDNGDTWTIGASLPNAPDAHVITFNGTYFVAVSTGNQPQVAYSLDGITWDTTSSAEQNGWRDVASGDGKTVAVSADGPNRVMYAYGQ